MSETKPVVFPRQMAVQPKNGYNQTEEDQSKTRLVWWIINLAETYPSNRPGLMWYINLR